LPTSVRPKSDAVNDVTWLATPSSTVAAWNAEIASATDVSSAGCVINSASWVSNPPSETKNTWRLTPSASALPIMRATIFS